MTSLEQLSLMMMRIKKMGLRNEGGGDKVTVYITMPRHVRSRHPVSSPQISRPSLHSQTVKTQHRRHETFTQTEAADKSAEYFLKFILDSLLYMYCVLRCWVFIHVLCDLSVVTWGSMSQCHGHCNASCHMSHTGHYTLHYNTASINHYTLGSDRYPTLSPWAQVTRSPGHRQFDQHLRGRGLRHWHCSDNEDKCVSFASMRGRLFFMSIRHVVMTGWRVDGDQCTGVIIL